MSKVTFQNTNCLKCGQPFGNSIKLCNNTCGTIICNNCEQPQYYDAINGKQKMGHAKKCGTNCDVCYGFYNSNSMYTYNHKYDCAIYLDIIRSEIPANNSFKFNF